jgi:hypothetical protein
VLGILLDGSSASYAVDPYDVTGMTPEQVQQVIQNERQINMYYDQILVEELKRRRDNPFWNCQFVANVVGKDPDEAKKIAVKLGATNIQWGVVSTTSASGTAYKCPSK